jgi:PhoH-like ATPase
LKPSAKKIFILDTNVLMHDPASIFSFQEHDVYIPMVVLEELDKHKRGLSEVARNVRQVSRYLDELANSAEDEISKGIPLANRLKSKNAGNLYFYIESSKSSLHAGLDLSSVDNKLLGIAHDLDKRHPDNDVILVTKDINLRIKSHALHIHAEDYTSDQAVADADLLHTGSTCLTTDFWDEHGKKMESWQEEGRTFYRITGPLVASWQPNEFLYVEDDSFQAIVKEIENDSAVIETPKDYSSEKHSVWGILARNREQNYALNLLMDPEIDFVSLLGHAGTGKTLLSLAAALAQTLDSKIYNEIIVTRVTIPVGEDIGYLPGTEEEKMGPWMGALEDNIEVLQNFQQQEHGSWGRAVTEDLLRQRINIKSMNFMRGRTFQKKVLIIDEAQNLSPHQIKTLVTRAGPGSKIICLGNLSQIDTPYLTETTNGLAYVVDRFRQWQHSGHITLQRGERSRLADYANEAL